jgi:hypothetical protein
MPSMGLHESIETNLTAFEQLDQLHDILLLNAQFFAHGKSIYSGRDLCIQITESQTINPNSSACFLSKMACQPIWSMGVMDRETKIKATS